MASFQPWQQTLALHTTSCTNGPPKEIRRCTVSKRASFGHTKAIGPTAAACCIQLCGEPLWTTRPGLQNSCSQPTRTRRHPRHYTRALRLQRHTLLKAHHADSKPCCLSYSATPRRTSKPPSPGTAARVLREGPVAHHLTPAAPLQHTPPHGYQ